MSNPLDNYVDKLVSDELLKLLNQVCEYEWWNVEKILAKLYLALLYPFIRNRHQIRHKGFFGFPLPDLPEIGSNSSSIRLGAVNYRGLFRQNGRLTLLEPCGNFRPHCTDSDQHDYLHAFYMRLVGKADSINQLFLASTSLASLSVIFDASEGGAPTVEIVDQTNHAKFVITPSLSQLLTPALVSEEWSKTIHEYLTESMSKDDIKKLLLGEEKRLLRLISLYDPVSFNAASEKNVINRAMDAMSKHVEFYRGWLSLPFRTTILGPARAGSAFEAWFHSLGLLPFYCSSKHAGNWFCTLRLPAFVADGAAVIPDTSVSLVAQEQPDEKTLNAFLSLRSLIEEHPVMESIRGIVNDKYHKFERYRLGNLSTDDKHKDLGAALNHLKKSSLAIDRNKLIFLLKVARSIGGDKHEGQPLRFCFVFGFSWQRIDAESGGLLRELSTDLKGRWCDFCKYFKLKDGQDKQYGDGLIRWIKSNDLQLQRSDVAVFFEETSESLFPVPTRIVRICHRIGGETFPVATEVQLRDALRLLTQRSSTTVGVLTVHSGLIVYYAGSCLLVPCGQQDDWDVPVNPRIAWDGKPIEEEVKDFIKEELEQTFSNTFLDSELDPKTIIADTAEILNKLCDTLVTMRHGSLIVVRSDGAKYETTLQPLNPVWCLHRTISAEAMQRECTTYALMAALDGATEIVIPSKSSKQELLFGCRKFVQTSTPVWRGVNGSHDGDAVLCDKEFTVEPIELVGKGTRHHSALSLSKELGSKALVITVSADGPITLWRDGAKCTPPPGVRLRYAP